MAQIRAEGVADNLIAVSGVRAVAVPVLSDGSIVAALAVIGTSFSVPEDDKAALAARLTEVADLLAADLATAKATSAR
ncbi:hypothetical protein [Aeromicrobium sp. UC242_57]|uniref:hypothetical protein n=1 Tax=Aeromicrobium sp. UC242_57 TaxID=3374624 RepID=UPI00379BD439